MRLNGNILPWVKSGKYLGAKLTGVMDSFAQDSRIKRAIYIEKNCELNQEFGFAHPQVKCQINRIYNTSFPGSILWDLNSRNVQMLENSWSVSVRHMWDLPNDSHRYFVEPLGGIHARSMLVSRYVSFLQSTKRSKKKSQFSFYSKWFKMTWRQLLEKNVRYILTELDQSDIFKITKSYIKKNLHFGKLIF